MTPNQIGFALLYLGLFLLIGKWIRIRVKWMQNLFLPSSVIGGFLALILGPQVLGLILKPVTGEESFWSTGLLSPEIMDGWSLFAVSLVNAVVCRVVL